MRANTLQYNPAPKLPLAAVIPGIWSHKGRAYAPGTEVFHAAMQKMVGAMRRLLAIVRSGMYACTQCRARSPRDRPDPHIYIIYITVRPGRV